MPSPLHLLILEDRSADAELILHELRRAGLAADGRRVETEADYVAALDPALDLILADYSLPQFSALRALQLLQQRGLDIPFIIVTGSISEEVAVECMKQGAADYLLKDRMTRLGQAVTHALEQKRLRAEHQRAAEALRESEARFRVIFEHANDAIHVSNAADEILEVNPRLCELMGYSRAELLKMHVADLQAPEVRSSAGSVIANELARFGRTTFEGVNLHHSGRPIPVEISVARMDSVQGDLFVSIVRDITARKRAEEALQESEAKFRSYIEYAPLGVFVVDRSGRCVEVNAAATEMLGFTEADLLPLSIPDILAPQSLEAGLQHFQTVGQDGAATAEFLLHRKDGTLFWATVNAVKLGEDRFMAYCQDITERKRAELALQDSESSLQGILQSTADGILAVNRENRLLFANERFSELWRIPPEVMAAKDDAVLLQYVLDQLIEPPAFLKKVQALYASREDSFDILNFKDGRVFERVSHPLRQGAELHGRVWSFRDITARKQAEEAIRESARRERERVAELQTIMDAVPAAIWIAHDQMSQVITGNRAAYDLLHMPPGSNASRTAPEGQPLTRTKIYQNGVDLPPNDLPLQISAATGVEIRDFEQELVFDDGTIVYELGNVMPLFDEEGRPRGAVGAFVDITERKHAEAALAQERLLLRTVIDNLPDAVYAKDRQGRKILVNRADLDNIGKSEAEVLGKTDAELFPQQIAAQFEADDQSVLHSGQPVLNREELLINEQGKQIWQRTSKLPLKDAAGQIVGLVGIGHNITDRKQAEEEHLTHLRFFENMDKVNRAIQGTPDLEQMMSDVLETLLSIFDCDRSWLLYPCDPDAPSFRVPMEVTRPEYPGAKILNVDVPMSPGETQNMREALESDGPVTYTAGTDRPISTAEQFGVQSQMFVPVYPKLGKPWAFGMHQCSYPRVWTQEEKKLFQEIGRRLTDGLTSLLAYRDLRESEAILKEAQRVGRLGSWDWDVQTDTITWSEEYYRIYGFDPQQHPPGYVEHLKAYTPESAARLDVAVKMNLQTGEPYKLDLELARPDGPSRWITSRSETRRDKNGRIVGLRGTAQDITERKRMEEHLREQVATLQAVAEIDREITAAMEPKGILELVCRRAAELVHAPKSVLIVKTVAAELDLTASYGLRDAARLKAEFARTQQTGLMNFDALKVRGSIVQNEIPADAPFMSETVSREGARALAIVPLVTGEGSLGALIVLDTTTRQWRAADLQVLNMLAAQAALALEKLRLFQADRTRAAQLAMLNEIAQSITSSLDLDRVLVTLLDKVRRASTAEACSVALVDKESGDLVFRQAVGGATHEVIGLRLSLGEGVAGWVAQHRQSVRVDDVASDAWVHALQNTTRPGGTHFVTHNLVCVPLIVRDTVTGVLELVNSQRGKFGQDDVQLLESVAAQAAIVIENVRLFETEHTARERLETLYRIGKAINSTLEADVILDRLTDEAVQATQATHGSALVARPERGCFERRSLRGYSPEEADRARTDALPLERGVNGRAYHLRHPVYIDDVTADPDYHPLIPTTRSELAVPIVRGGQVIGNLDLQSPNVNAFHAIDLPFLQALTDQVAIALENARLFAETLRQMDELTIVSQVALVGAAGRPFDETVARATDALSRLWPEAALGFLFVDEGGQALRMHASYLHPSPELDPLVSIGLDQGLTGWAARQQQPLRVGDVTTDPRYVMSPLEAGRHAGRVARTANTRSEMVAPLVVGKQVIGVVNVETPSPDAFSGDDLRLLTTLAGQLAVIFEKARLDAALHEHTVLLEQRVLERTAEIHRQQARTQAILDALGEGVVVTDPQGVIQYMNPAMEQTTGFSAPEALGQEAYLWRSDQTPADMYREMWATVRAGRTWAGEVVNRRKDGEYYFASLTTAPIQTTDGGTAELAGVVSIQRDITERKQAEEEMQRALEKERELNTLKSRFVSLTSHEFRTPLTTILSSAEMIEHYGARWGVERTHEHLQRIQTSVKYMTGLLDDILVVGKAEADRLEFAPEPLDLLKFCRGLVEEFELMDTGQHPLRFESSGACSEVRLDEQLLRHIFSNLLSNAFKYSPPGSAVEFEVTCQAGQAVFRIQDHGLGIPLEDQARLFETFHRARNVRNIAGTGLGLTIVKRSVDLHGGTIEVVSQVEVGTTVTVSLPTGRPDEGEYMEQSPSTGGMK